MVAYELDDLERYVVRRGNPVGYFEVVSALLVCYSGHPSLVLSRSRRCMTSTPHWRRSAALRM